MDGLSPAALLLILGLTCATIGYTEVVKPVGKKIAHVGKVVGVKMGHGLKHIIGK